MTVPGPVGLFDRPPFVGVLDISGDGYGGSSSTGGPSCEPTVDARLRISLSWYS